jgi:hypothetical protein
MKGICSIEDFVKTYMKSLVNVMQFEEHGMFMYNDTAIDMPDELHLDMRDFTPESNCQEISQYIVIRKWNKEMYAFLYFAFLEPFFRSVLKIKKTKIFDWIRHSFDSNEAANYANNELVNLARKPLANALVEAIDESGRVRNDDDNQFHKDCIIITSLIKTDAKLAAN